MNFFKLEQQKSEQLSPFPEIFEFGYEKQKKVRLGSLQPHFNPGVEICFVKEGKYNWVIEGKPYILYPNSASITMPWEHHGSMQGFLDIGVLFWIIINPQTITRHGELALSDCFSYDKLFTKEIGKIITSGRHPVILDGTVIGRQFEELAVEIITQPFGYINRVYHLLYDMLLCTARDILKEVPEKEDFVSSDLEKLNTALSKDLSYDWSVEEMAHVMGRGITSFTMVLKNKTGFTPLNYLIELRIAQAKKLLIETGTKITNVALMCGFSSSQHFSNTFKLKTGLSPSEFLKKYT